MSSASTVWILIINISTIAVILITIIFFHIFHHSPPLSYNHQYNHHPTLTPRCSFHNLLRFPPFWRITWAGIPLIQRHTVWIISRVLLRQNHISASQSSHILSKTMTCSWVDKQKKNQQVDDSQCRPWSDYLNDTYMCYCVRYVNAHALCLSRLAFVFLVLCL